MKNFLLLFIACCLLNGCGVDSDTPLSAPGKLSPDDAVLGTWKSVRASNAKDSERPSYLHIGNANGQIKILSVEFEDDGSIKTEEFSASSVSLNGDTFASIQLPIDGKMSYVLARYQVGANDRLKVWLADYGWVKSAIESGIISGNVAPNTLVPAAHLAGNDGEALRNFVSSNRDKIFTDFVEFSRAN
jgi:hypothetical protein